MTLGLNIKPEHNLEEIDVVELYDETTVKRFVPVDNLLKIIERTKIIEESLQYQQEKEGMT